MSIGPMRCMSRVQARRACATASAPPVRAPSAIGNQARLKQLRLGASPVRSSCGPSEDCDAASTRLDDKLGIAKCNPYTGVVETTIIKELCAGACVRLHEKTHAQDDKVCCAIYADCMKKAGNDETAKSVCREKWDRYAKATEAFTECNAYTAEYGCIEDEIADNCGPGGRTDKGCCSDLRERLAFVGRLKSAYCGQEGAGFPLPCGRYFN